MTNHYLAEADNGIGYEGELYSSIKVETQMWGRACRKLVLVVTEALSPIVPTKQIN